MPGVTEDRPLSELLSITLFLASVLIYAWKAGRNTWWFAATLTVLGIFIVLNITLYASDYFTGDGINDDIISKEIIPMIKKLAKKNDLSVIDLHTAMDGMPELFPDRIHPNEKGAQVMAKAVYQSISALK